MRRSDRAVEVMARRTPWILRGMARLAPATGRNHDSWVGALGGGGLTVRGHPQFTCRQDSVRILTRVHEARKDSEIRV